MLRGPPVPTTGTPAACAVPTSAMTATAAVSSDSAAAPMRRGRLAADRILFISVMSLPSQRLPPMNCSPNPSAGPGVRSPPVGARLPAPRVSRGDISMFVFRAAVVGAGTMGGQIAQTIAAAGIPVVLKDIDDALVEAGVQEARGVTAAQVGKLAEKGRITAEQADGQIAEILGRIHGTTSYERFGQVDFVIEAVPERMEIKQSVFAELDAATPGHAILASNTSSLTITEIGEATLRPEKVIGFHYFYPASIMPLIEIVEGEETSAE